MPTKTQMRAEAEKLQNLKSLTSDARHEIKFQEQLTEARKKVFESVRKQIDYGRSAEVIADWAEGERRKLELTYGPAEENTHSGYYAGEFEALTAVIANAR